MTKIGQVLQYIGKKIRYILITLLFLTNKFIKYWTFIYPKRKSNIRTFYNNVFSTYRHNNVLNI